MGEAIRLALTAAVADVDEMAAEGTDRTSMPILVLDVGGDLWRIAVPWALRLAAEFRVGTPVDIELLLPLQVDPADGARNGT